MHAPIIGPALCACGWHGTARAAAPCPDCKRPHGYRMTPRKLALLRALAEDPMAPRNRSALASLISLGLVRPAGPAPAPSEFRRAKAPLRPYTPSAAGVRLVAIADGIIAEQTRHDVAASVSRHAAFDVSDVSGPEES